MKLYSLLAVGLMLTTWTASSAQMKVRQHHAAQEKASTNLLNTSSSRTVLASKKVAEGVEKRIVRDADGRVFRDIVRNGAVSAGRRSLSIPMRAPSNATFYESFEGHQGEPDWIPEGWTEINTEANKPTPEMCTHNINNSWSAQDTGDGYWTDITTDGVKEAWIHFTYDWQYKDSEGQIIKGGPDPQDEWLITPEITVRPNDNLYFLAECDLGAVFPFSWSSMQYDLAAGPECDLEVLATTDNGENWSKIWSLSENVCSKMSDSEMYDAMADLKYSNYFVSLEEYRGKTVKIAFRYLNIGDGLAGNSMAIDAVTVTAPQPEAYYQLPYGSLLAGVSEELSALSSSYCLMPAWTPVKWAAESNATTEINEWTIYDEKSAETATAEGNTLTLEYTYSDGVAYPYPLLTAKAGELFHSYSFDSADETPGGIYYGGRIPKLEFGGEFPAETMLVGNYDYQHKHLVCPYLDNDAYCFGTSPANTWGNGVKQTGFANFFPAPAAPFTVEDVYVTLGECDLDDDAEILLEIFEADENGTLATTPAATATVKGSEITGFGFYQVKFHLEAPFSMKGNTLMMVSGFDSDKVRTFAACAQALSNDAQHNYAYMMFEIGGQKELYAASEALLNYSSALFFSLNGAYHFLRADEQIVDLDASSNEVTVSFTASSAPEDWWIIDGEETIALSSEPVEYKWLTVAPAAEGNALVFTADANPTDRAVTVVLANGGEETRVRVRQQGTSGVSALASDQNAISLLGNMLTVANAGDVSIAVYSTDGRKMATGRNGLDVSGLNAGVYVVRAGKATYKFVK